MCWRPSQPDLYTFFDFDAVVTLDDLRFWLGETGAGGEFNSMIAASAATSLELINSSLEMAGFTFDAVPSRRGLGGSADRARVPRRYVLGRARVRHPVLRAGDNWARRCSGW